MTKFAISWIGVSDHKTHLDIARDKRCRDGEGQRFAVCDGISVLLYYHHDEHNDDNNDIFNRQDTSSYATDTTASCSNISSNSREGWQLLSQWHEESQCQRKNVLAQ
jgi:hypothetical protein